MRVGWFLRSWVPKKALVKLDLAALATLRAVDLPELPPDDQPGSHQAADAADAVGERHGARTRGLGLRTPVPCTARLRATPSASLTPLACTTSAL